MLSAQQVDEISRKDRKEAQPQGKLGHYRFPGTGLVTTWETLWEADASLQISEARVISQAVERVIRIQILQLEIVTSRAGFLDGTHLLKPTSLSSC